MNTLFRFWSKVDTRPGQGPEGTCWLWRGKTVKGYGSFTVDGRRTATHRYSFALFHAPVADALVCHTCDTPRCVNPKHLFTGTHLDNSRDCVCKGRQSRGEARSKILRGVSNGRAKLSEADVLAIRRAEGTRQVIADRFAISKSAVDHIRSGGCWKHLNQE